jgi:hypothetical protein
MSEIIGKIGPLRFRLGDECGDVFADDDDFDGLTLTVEVRDEAEGRRLIEALRGAVERPDPLGEALNSGDGAYRP